MVKGEITLLTIDDRLIVVENGGQAEDHTNVAGLSRRMSAQFKQENFELNPFTDFSAALKHIEEKYGAKSVAYAHLKQLQTKYQK